MTLSPFTLDEFFDEVHHLYVNAIKLTADSNHGNITRHYQHVISSQLEDLFAVLLSNILTPEFPDIGLRFLLDAAIHCEGVGKMRPDISIVAGKSKPTLVAYLDVKTDLGFKRNYFESYEQIVQKIKLLKSAVNNKSNTNIHVATNLRYRTIFVSEDNSSGKIGINKSEAMKYAQDFEVYFLSTGDHPNNKDRSKVIPNKEEFSNLLDNIRGDILAIGEVNENTPNSK